MVQIRFMNDPLIPILINFLISGLVAYFIGHGRRIGLYYSFFLCITLTPVVGGIISLFSPSLKSHKAYLPVSGANKIWAIILFVLSALIIIGLIWRAILADDNPYLYNNDNVIQYVVVIVGLIIWGAYLEMPPNYPKPDNLIMRKPKPTRVKVEQPVIVVTPVAEEEKIKEIKDNSSRNKYKIIIAAILLIFIFTNPGVKRFKDYMGYRNYGGLRREQNWILFSIYSNGNNKYLAVIFNFFELKK